MKSRYGDLLDDLQRVGNAAGPKRVPNAVDLTADFAGEHGASQFPLGLDDALAPARERELGLSRSVDGVPTAWGRAGPEGDAKR